MSDIKIWRYHIPSKDGLSGWGTFILDSTGLFTAITDYGNFAFRWTHHGRNDFRQFVIDLEREWSYLLGKVRPRGMVYNGEKTARAIKEHIIEYRRLNWYTKKFAREEFDLIRDCEDLDHEYNYYEWHRHTELEDAHEYYHTAYQLDDLAFAQELMPRLAAVIRKELESEGVAA